jgi:hypothetical protein
MIYPATLNLRILQNSTFKLALRVLQNVKTATLLEVVTANSAPYFELKNHEFVAGTKVVFLPAAQTSASDSASSPASSGAALPGGIEANSIYFVHATGLTTNLFTVSATVDGTPITLDEADAQAVCVAQPLNLTDYTVDSDIYGVLSNEEISTFTCSIPTPLDGLVELLLPAATSVDLEQGTYAYDVSLITPEEERYYWLKGTISLERTYSRT